MMRKVIKDAAGKVIHIGDWDFVVRDMVRLNDDGEPVLDDEGAPLVDLVETNPLPAGAYEDNVDIVAGWDGGLYAADDPRRLGGA